MLATTANSVESCDARFNAWGEPEADSGCLQPGKTSNSRWYNGDRADETTGTYQNGSRTYDPAQATWLSADGYRTAGAGLDLSVSVDPLTRNRYSYVNGDPVNLHDPDGHKFSWKKFAHLALDVAGVVPVIGEIADLANCAFYAVEGNMVDAALSCASAIPIAGYAATAAKAAKHVDEAVAAGKAAKELAEKKLAKEAAERLAREKAAKEAAEKARREAAEKAARAAERAKAEAAQRAAAQQAAKQAQAPRAAASGRGGATPSTRTATNSTNNRPTGAAPSRAAETGGLADDALVVRGGQNLPDNIAGGSGVTMDAAGRAQGVSVQAGTESLETIVRGHVPHGQIGVTTAGEIRAAGGTISRDPLPGNPWHCLVSCITPEALSNLLRPTIKNPFR